MPTTPPPTTTASIFFSAKKKRTRREGGVVDVAMLRKSKSSQGIGKGTPATSRKVYVFSKWLTQADQVELVEKDMEAAQRFGVQRHRLSGLERERGTLVIGVTAVTFLSPEPEHNICFVHPYQIIGAYLKNDKGQFEYALTSKYKNVKYVFDPDEGVDVGAIVAEIDRRSLRLEKSIASGGKLSGSSGAGDKSPRGGGAGDKSPRGGGDKSPRSAGGVPVFDPDVAAPPNKAEIPRQKVTQVPGSRFRVKMLLDGIEHKAVAIVSSESITIVDPTTNTGDNNPNAVHYRSCKWAGITSITSSKDEVKIVSRDGVTVVLVVQDAHAFIAEINRKRDEAAAAATTGAPPPSEAAAAAGGDEGGEDEEVLKW